MIGAEPSLPLYTYVCMGQLHSLYQAVFLTLYSAFRMPSGTVMYKNSSVEEMCVCVCLCANSCYGWKLPVTVIRLSKEYFYIENKC